uniref:Uncharacterized protein n=1 Tax=Arundo donax TaxID=35708 RepID=A0A0A9FKB9_ARUDO
MKSDEEFRTRLCNRWAGMLRRWGRRAPGWRAGR